MGTLYSRNFLKHVKVILMRFLNKMRDRVPTSYILSTNKTPSTETTLRPIELLAKERDPWKSQIIQFVTKTNRFLSPTDKTHTMH